MFWLDRVFVDALSRTVFPKNPGYFGKLVRAIPRKHNRFNYLPIFRTFHIKPIKSESLCQSPGAIEYVDSSVVLPARSVHIG